MPQNRFARELARSLKVKPPSPEHSAAVLLAQKYADLLDEWDGLEGEEDTFASIGPKYLQTLKALGLTPDTRAKERGEKNDGGGNPLLKLVGERGAATRKHPAA